MATIAVIGTGNMASGLGKGLAAKGHRIQYGSRDPQSKGDLVTQTPGSTVRSYAEALLGAVVVIVALPYTAVEPFAREHAAALRGLLVIDISNPFDHLPDNRIAGAEVTAAAIGAGARVAAAFKGTFAANLGTPHDPSGLQRDVHFATDAAQDKEIVAGLIRDLGFQPVDCGALRNARILDSMVSLMVELEQRYGGSWTSGWKFLV